MFRRKRRSKGVFVCHKTQKLKMMKELRFRPPGESALQQKLLDQQGQFRGKRFQDRIILLHGRAESPMKARCHGSILAPHPTGSRLFPQQAAKAGRRRCLTCFRENGRRSRRNAGSSFPHDAWKRPSRCISIFSKRKAPSGENPDGAAASGISPETTISGRKRSPH